MGQGKKMLAAFDLLFLIILIVVDQVSKYFAVLKLKDGTIFRAIDGVLEFRYLENKGAAFGLLQNQKALFLFVGIIFLCAICYVLYQSPYGRKYTVLHILLVTIAGGAIGNMIDRIRLDYVVDFIYFSYINFPIFNVADMYVTTASIILCILFLFYYKEEDLSFLNFKQNKYREQK